MDIRPIDAKDLSLIIRKHIPALGYGVRDSFLRKAVDKTTVECLHFTLDKIDKAPTLSLNTLRDAIYQDAVEHGLWEKADKMAKEAAEDESGLRERELVEKFFKWHEAAQLVFFEGDEMLTAVEDYKWDSAAEELADVVIMAMSAAGYLGIDIDAAIRRKMAINQGRAWKHGKE